MKIYEGFVIMTMQEYKKKEPTARYYGTPVEDTSVRSFMEGDLCYYNGNIYISMINNNTNYPKDSSWKLVKVEN